MSECSLNSPVIVALPGNESMAEKLASHFGVETVALEYRRFPDGESYLRLHGDPRGLDVVLVATLDQPDTKVSSLLFAADLVREMGAATVGLVAPYLAYMRQDQRFAPGEALTSRTFARWLSTYLDWLVTVDPHLHRYASLDEVYSLRSRVVAAAPVLAGWVASNIDHPVLIGPDAESEQWVSEVATLKNLPWRVFIKKRHGDRDVQMQLPDLSGLEDRTPVLIDDIISSGTTMARAASLLMEAGFPAPVAIGVHGLYAPGAREAMRAAGIARIVCTNSVNAAEAEIDLADALAAPIAGMLSPVR